jgi:hypothetical protein
MLVSVVLNVPPQLATESASVVGVVTPATVTLANVMLFAALFHVPFAAAAVK